ncbi:MAG: hypothetical protein R2789_09430 [Microthrixaceae bacterium]
MDPGANLGDRSGIGNAARDPRHERGDTPRPNPAARNAGTEGAPGSSVSGQARR